MQARANGSRVLAWFFVVTIIAGSAFAATTPASGTLSPSNPTLSFSGGPYSISNPSAATGETPPVCTDATCGVYTLTVNIPSTDFNSYKAAISVGWTNSGTTTQGATTSDFDVYVYSPDFSGTEVGSSASALNPESTSFPVTNGTYTIYVAPFDVSPSVTFNATLTLSRVTQTTWPSPSPAPPLPAGTPRFFNYHAPPGVAEDAGEPSIGVNRKTEKVFGGIPNGGTVNYFGGFLPYMLSVTFDDRTTPATTTWNQVPLVLANAARVFGDPILFTDRDTGRTFVSQELGLTPLGSTMEFTDNDNAPLMPSMGSGAPSGVDHQTVAGGPYHAPIPTGVNPLYPNGVWYCSQAIAYAVCSISLDGGVTFGPAVPMYGVQDCAGIHGHLKIGRDGTAYLPNRACGGDLPYHPNGHPALIVSENNGITWSIRPLTQATTMDDRDPSVAVAEDGTVYFAYQAADGHSHVAVSKDKGLTWIRDTDVGASMHIENALFHAAVAGDGNRAAVAYFGTETAGAYSSPDFPGVWYLFISTTFDGGVTWVTQNATPGDPIQRGGICGDGTCRNLLDFFDATIDKEGRVLVGYDDGCISANCIAGQRSYGLSATNDFTAKAVIARQASGRRMYAAFDSMAGPDLNPAAPAPPGPPLTTCSTVVATDPAGDADHPLLHANGGNADQVDITSLSFGLSADGQSLVTTINVKNFTPQPLTGSLGTFYYATWTAARKNSDGSIATRNYATRVSVDVRGTIAYAFGEYDQAADAFVGSTTTVTGSTVSGVNGSLSVNVPLSLLGNPTVPVNDLQTLPAVIEPYAVAIAHEQAVRFTTPADRAPNVGAVGASWQVCPPVVTAIEENHPSISYTSGWHSLNAAAASGGHFRMHSGNSNAHSLSLTVTVPQGRKGKITFAYATSPRAGTAEVFIDGATRGTINFAGTSGSTFVPQFGASASYPNLAAGAHTFELRNLHGTVYVDGFVLEDATPTSTATATLGTTSSSANTQAPAQTSTTSLDAPAGTQTLSVVAESSSGAPVRILLLDPLGLTLATADGPSGLATLEQPVSGSGVYLVKVINLGLTPSDIQTAVTPLVLP
ncbi:MAG: exo-alpha-sialidase [Acidobacteria bacterium]|nr:exo-alpha-sialidase [Acidobacteriota bacterium]MBV9477725.1 exo-alpha-sialidase [Acidobacteriota bacterium]